MLEADPFSYVAVMKTSLIKRDISQADRITDDERISELRRGLLRPCKLVSFLFFSLSISTAFLVRPIPL